MFDQNTDLITRIGLLSGTGTTGLGWMASVDWVAYIGVIILVATFFVNFMFRRREDRRKQERHDLEMAQMRSKISP